MINMRPVGMLIGSAAAALALTVLALGGGAESKVRNANNHVYPPDSKPFGMTYGEWSGTWWQWALGIPAQVTPFLDPDGAQCGTLQSGPVWFLAGTSGPLSSVTRTCSIPSGRAILIPIMNFLNDYPCPDAAFQPTPGQSIEAFLAAGAAAIADQIDVLEGELDGQPIVDLTTFRARSPLVSFTGAANLSFLDSCITGSPQLGVADGYWLLLKPLSRGNHTLHIKGASSALSISTEATYHLTIVSQ
jgi:hypothetical protein